MSAARLSGLTPVDRNRLDALLAAIGSDGSATVQAVFDALFPDLQPDTANKALTRLGASIRQAAHHAGTDFRA